MRVASTRRGIARSLRLYYGDPERARRMDALAARFVPPGGLAFDIGAHVGDRTASFRRLGARVVAVEPQSAAMRALRLIHGRDPGVALVEAAVGAEVGRATLLVNSGNPTVSTLSPDFVAAAGEAAGWRDERWDRMQEAELVTLDLLIRRHGRPDFVKIDVEGYEDLVLAGLGAPVPVLSFEFTTLRRGVAAACIVALERLGHYEFNASFGETHALALTRWLDAAGIAAWLAEVPQGANSGDVYARLCPGAAAMSDRAGPPRES